MNIKVDELKRRAEEAYRMLEACQLCPRNCGVNRLKERLGYCGIGREAMVSSFGPHFGEESVLVGRFGSGTIFFTSCNLSCVFCQNYDISQQRLGRKVSEKELSDMIISLQEQKCHNINFVSPTHVVPQILKAIELAKEEGLRLPLVYNSGGYDSIEALRLLDKIIDIYMPDAKYGNKEIARQFSGVSNYPLVLKQVLKEMHRQVGELVVNNQGIAVGGLLIRHLVLPNALAGSREIMHFIARELSQNSYVNIMDQYRPTYKAGLYPQLNRQITPGEYREAIKYARSEGLHRGF